MLDGEWMLLHATPFERVWVATLDDDRLIVKRETLMHSLTAEANAVDFNASDGRRWGDGQVIARVPLDIYFRTIQPMEEAGDTAGLKRFYNDADNRWMRTFKGAV